MYVKVNDDVTRLSRIDRMWSDPQGTVYFQGPYYVTPAEFEHERTRTFYSKGNEQIMLKHLKTGCEAE